MENSNPSISGLPDDVHFNPTLSEVPLPAVYNPVVTPSSHVLASVLKQLEPLKRDEIARILRAAATFFDVTEELEM